MDYAKRTKSAEKILQLTCPEVRQLKIICFTYLKLEVKFMPIDFGSLKKVAEGKTKIIYENPEDPKTAYMVFKDDITAGDGVKHDIIKGKALVDWRTNRDIFELLNRKGVRTHYLSCPQEKAVLVKKLDRKINLEVVSRRVAAGSILKWGTVAEGTRFDPVITQFHYKDDPLHDPMLDEKYIDYIVKAKGGSEYSEMRRINAEVFLHLEDAFAKFGIQLVDMKLEYGIIEGDVYLIDEITGGSFRLWPYAHKNPNLNQSNVLKELNPEGRLDKDTYRMGEKIDEVLTKFEEIAKVTAKFADL
jgi:phosphoribosylaminoimidazole-succinocarboxamide synthase